MTIKSDIVCSIHKNIEALQKTFDKEHADLIYTISEIITCALQEGKKVLLCGNGGSAADAQHIAAEFVGRFKKERKSYPAIALTTDTSIITAVSNDYSFETVFSRQVEGLGNQGDVLIGISTSGNSQNVIQAFAAAKKQGLTTIAFAGQGGGKMKDIADYTFTVASDYTPYVQSAHIIALHTMCEAIENTLVQDV